LRHGVWLRRGDWQPVYAIEQQKQTGAEYQHYAYDADHKLVCAGVTRHERMNQAIANQITRVWRCWRREYVARNPGNYPTATSGDIRLLLVFPIDDPKAQQWFYV
jgi:hypothetical protein